MTAAVEDLYAEAFRAAIAPDPEVSVDEWADAHRVLTPGEGNEVGPYRTSRVPFLREPMRYLSAHHPSRELAIMKAGQMGVTQVLVNWIGYLIDTAPAPILFFLPTREVAKQTSETRIDPMFEGTPALAGKVARSRSRDRRNTILSKKFTGGELTMRGANSGNAFRNIAARFIAGDDLDGWPGEVGTEGDPITLLKKRAFTYPNAKYCWVSTPTIKGLSRIEQLYLAGDQRRYFLPCPHCGEKRALTWTGHLDFVAKRDPGHHRIEWDKTPEDRPETAAMACGACGKRTPEEQRQWLLDRGEWVPTRPGPRRPPSWHIPALIAPPGWGSWAEMADHWLKIQGNRLELKAFINTTLAETFEDRGQGAAPESILDRLEDYGAGDVPDGVGILVAAVDVQGDRLEVLVVGFGPGLESWVIHWESIEGDPARDEVWFELDEVRRRTFCHVSGQTVRIECTVVDSGGHHAGQVYRYAKLHRESKVYAVKGSTETGRPIVERPTYNNAARVPLYLVCTDTAKEEIFAALDLQPALDPGARVPGCMHFPRRPWLNAEYAAQLTSEKGLWRYVKGKGMVRRWEQIRERNEVLDLTVYARAAVWIRLRIAQRGRAALGELAARAERFSRRVESAPPEASSPAPSAPPRGRARPGARPGWVRGWRR